MGGDLREAAGIVASSMDTPIEVLRGKEMVGYVRVMLLRS
jgi:hypothetical protein